MNYSSAALDLQLLNYKRVGLLGGSFNSAHVGHLEMSKYALRELKLDYVIWLVASQNPLKAPYKMSLEERATYAKQVATDPRIIVPSLEEDIKSPYTYDTLLYLRKTFPTTHFTWLMGADCLEQFHLWEHFDEFTKIVDVAIFNRKGADNYINSTIGGRALQKESLKNNQFRVILCNNDLVDISSTEIRKGMK
jgi:nicotinate-nucleotide adenylyltransferase